LWFTESNFRLGFSQNCAIQSGVVFLLLQALEVAAAAVGSPFIGIIIWSFLEEDLGVGCLRDHRSKEEEASKANKGSKQARGGLVFCGVFSAEGGGMGTRDIENLDAEDMFNEKDRRNPLVLCGAIATAGVLCAGLLAFRKGDFNRSQQMMRARVGFQAATVALMVGTVYVQGKT
jgi:hypothetical protein